MKEDKLQKVFAQLSALKANLPEGHHANEKYVSTYNSLVNDLSVGLGESLEEFSVPGNEIKQRVTSSNYLTKEVNYSKDKWCERSVLLMKLDSLLGYFTLKLQSTSQTPGNTLGFKATENKEK